jgi:hypothetical protein
MASGSFSSAGAALQHLTPRPVKDLYGSNYLSIAGNDYNFAKQFLPEVYEKEVERYGNRTISGFLKMVGAEMPMASDTVVWSEQGRIHVAFDDCSVGSDSTDNVLIFDDATKAGLVSPHDTIVIYDGSGAAVKAVVVSASGSVSNGVNVIPYAAANLQVAGIPNSTTGLKVFVYGTEYKKGSENAGSSKDADFTTFSNKPIILRDKYSINGSDTASIGWVEVTTEAGTGGYLWYLKSEHEARIRFEDQLEMAMIEAEKVSGSQMDSFLGTANGGGAGTGLHGTEGLFAAISDRGLVFNNPDFGETGSNNTGEGLVEFDIILQELDKQGSIEENMLFLNRGTSLAIDNMLAKQNSYGTGGTSYGVFDNSEDMALNLGFSGFRRGSYDFYKSDWKYLNDGTTRGLVGDVQGVLVPAGTSTVYDQILGKNIKRPFLHVRYRASEADDRRMKSWITGSVGGNYTSDEDAMNVHFLSERCLCVQAANNFILFKDADGATGDSD